MTLTHTLGTRSLLVVAGAILLASGARSAAAGQRVFGVVVDPLDVPIPQVEVILSDSSLKAKQKVKADPMGRFEFASVTAGPYVLRVALRGFQTLQQTITVVDDDIEQDLKLAVGPARETITVFAGTDLRSASTRAAKPPAPVCESGSRGGRNGGNLHPPTKILNVTPAYPATLAKRHISGTTIIRAAIGPDGSVVSPIIVSSTNGEMADAALAAVNGWRFDAARLNCESIELPFEVTVHFQP